MITLTEVLEVNWIILYFVYGQVFFIMGLVTGLQWRHQSQLELARALPWLAAFGITHGLTEWGYIFIPLQALYLASQLPHGPAQQVHVLDDQVHRAQRDRAGGVQPVPD